MQEVASYVRQPSSAHASVQRVSPVSKVCLVVRRSLYWTMLIVFARSCYAVFMEPWLEVLRGLRGGKNPLNLDNILLCDP